MAILVTGGMGFIGSHAVVKLIESEKEVILFDNLSNSKSDVLESIKKITGVLPQFFWGDIRSGLDLNNVFQRYQIDAVLHFAGLKSVNESISNPLMYYENNVVGSIQLLSAMKKFGIFKIVFSSSATVYGVNPVQPYKENFTRSPVNVYGYTKLVVEDVLRDLAISDDAWKIFSLRYFNPIGAHPSGLIGEKSIKNPNNIMPIIGEVATGLRDRLYIYGSDYATLDGTCRRDFVHVEDLADAHVCALEHLDGMIDNFSPVNIGTGISYSVLELIDTYQRVNKVRIPFEFSGRRDGDIGEYYADSAYAKKILGWSSKRSLELMCRDSWNWHKSFITYK